VLQYNRSTAQKATVPNVRWDVHDEYLVLGVEYCDAADDLHAGAFLRCGMVVCHWVFPFSGMAP
jgi:hypothetical protein